MDDLLDLIASGEKQSDVSSAIKDILYTKAAAKIDSIRPDVANSFFDSVETESEAEE